MLYIRSQCTPTEYAATVHVLRAFRRRNMARAAAVAELRRILRFSPCALRALNAFLSSRAPA